MKPFISSFEIITAFIPDPKIFFWIAASVANAAAVNSNGFKTLLANGLSTFFIKGNPVFSNGCKCLPRNPLDCPNLWDWVFDNFILTNELFAKTLRSLESCVLVNNNLCGKLNSSLDYQSHLMKDLKLFQFHFLFLILIY